jgi:hypothetical protein
MKDLKERLDELVKEGKEIQVTWDGGNDSGTITVYVGGKELAYGSSMESEISDVIDDALDYGSWAGDFTAHGSVVYDSEQGAFVGAGYEVTSDYTSTDCEIEFKVPKALNFDSISIETSGDWEYEPVKVFCRFNISNGPVFEEHIDLQIELQEILENAVINEISRLNCTVGSVYNDWEITRDMMEEFGDYLVFVIDSIGFEDKISNEKDHEISVVGKGEMY